MKILISANTSWYLYNFRASLIYELMANGYDVIGFSPTDQYTKKLKTLCSSHAPIQLNNAGVNPFMEMITLLHILFQVKQIQPALILGYTPKINLYLSLIARVINLPIIINVSGLGNGFTSGILLRGTILLMYRIAFKYPAKIFFQNNEDLDSFKKLKIIRDDSAERIPGSGVDLKRFFPVEKKTGDGFVFMLVARMLWEKGIGEFVAAAGIIKKKHANVSFILLGFVDSRKSSVPKQKIDDWVDCGLVEYPGASDDVRSFYKKADCVVLPSYYREGIPRSLLEAAAMGLPIITTDNVGCRDVVEDGVTGLLCKSRNSSDLADKMQKIILMDPAQRIAMGLAGRRKMEREFDERIVLSKYLEAIRSIEHSFTGKRESCKRNVKKYAET